MTEIIDILISNGSLGVFAGFLVWLYTNMQRRMDALVDKFPTALTPLSFGHADGVVEELFAWVFFVEAAGALRVVGRFAGQLFEVVGNLLVVQRLTEGFGV